jgi:transcriptional regulator with XRE-family HTH domain
MALAAQFDDLPEDSRQVRAPRRLLRLQATGTLATGERAAVQIHNVSATGLLIECSTDLAVGETIEVELPHAGPVAADVVWASASLFGCRFDEALSPAVLSATQLRGVTGAGVGDITGGSAEVPGLNLPNRALPAMLRELRRERGLTLGQLATRLGVSKPTVWAWEQGKSRPVPERIDAIADALAVAPEALLPERAAQGLPGILARCREQIAEAIGADPESIRISIDL